MIDLGKQIRTARKAEGITLETLARRSGFSKGYLSKLENDMQTPAVSTLQTLSRVLNCDLSDLMDSPEGPQEINGLEVVHAGEFHFQREDASYGYLRLVRNFRGKYMSPFTMMIEPECTTPEFSHDGEECVYVISGAIKLLYDHHEPVELETGSSVYFDARASHAFRNTGMVPALLFSVNFNYRRF